MATSVLVTGCCGFIGRHVVAALSAAGYEVHGIDLRSAPAEPRAYASFQACDIRRREQLLDCVRRCAPRHVIHLAARTDLRGASIAEYDTNTEGAANLVDAIRRAGGVERGIFTSSQLVCEVGRQPESDEDYCPETVYGASKARMEQIVRAADGDGIAWCIARPTTVWGPGMGPHYHRFLRMIQRGWYFHVGKGPLWKSYGYVVNIAHQYRALLEADQALVRGKTIYLADYEPLDLIDWAESLRAAIGARPIPTMPVAGARLLAWLGDQIGRAGVLDLPLNSFRLRNILTEYVYRLDRTEQICGPLPRSRQQGVRETATWFLASAQNKGEGPA